jgi:FkbM family methyltransferase
MKIKQYMASLMFSKKAKLKTRFKGFGIGRLLREFFLRNVQIELISCPFMVKGDLSDTTWARVYRRGYHELGLERLLCEFLSEGDIFIDVGAHVGVISAIASKMVGKTGEVHAFECSPYNIKQLERTIRNNRLANVRVVPKAAGEFTGEAFFGENPQGYGWALAENGDETVADGTVANAPLQTRLDRARGISSRLFRVPVVTIDDYISEKSLGRVTIVKIDVDGPEMNVLRGMTKLIESPEAPVLVVESSRQLMEYGSSPEEMFTFLSEAGYDIFGSLRLEDKIMLFCEAADLMDYFSFKGKRTLNLYCRIPEIHEGRWKNLWFANQVWERESKQCVELQ